MGHREHTLCVFANVDTKSWEKKKNHTIFEHTKELPKKCYTCQKRHNSLIGCRKEKLQRKSIQKA